MRARAVSAACVAAAALALAACGGDDEPSATTGAGTPTPEATLSATTPPAETTSTTPPTATTGVPKGGVTTGAETTSTSGGGESGEGGEGGAGDEEATRVPVTLTHGSGVLSPTIVTVPAFLTLEITISGPSTTATLPGGTTLAVPGTQTVAGLKPGKYPISTADGGRTILNVVNGGDPGP